MVITSIAIECFFYKNLQKTFVFFITFSNILTVSLVCLAVAGKALLFYFKSNELDSVTLLYGDVT